jgi:glycosyltransferase involved in cell wall biosynthesis
MSYKVSVIIPVYKVETYLHQCIVSVINQTYQNLEIILVDDGSPDGSGSICDEFAKRDVRIKVIHQLNQGGCYAMQKGADLATGDFIMYLDGDDWISLDTCELSMAICNKHKNVDIVFWSFIKEYPNTAVSGHSFCEGDRLYSAESYSTLITRFIGLRNDQLEDPMRTDLISAVWGKLFRASLLKDNDNYLVSSDGNQYFDVVVNLHLFTKAKSAYYLSKFLNHYRQYNLSSTTKNHKLNLADKYIQMFDQIRPFVNTKNDSLAFGNRIALSVINISLSVTSKKIANSHRERINHLSSVLKMNPFRSSLESLETTRMPIHWKFFFFVCKSQLGALAYCLALIMRKFR